MSAADMSGPDEPPKTRLDAAKEAARETIRRLGRRSEPAQVMIVAFGASAKVISGFQSSR
ncbi:MAG: hypothetical protein GTO47_14130, partial [Gammaproteobacteria bacterium]|nr:hypothetical protein [Gammaproteobacteria bacterium]